jgi:hypothetical protein
MRSMFARMRVYLGNRRRARRYRRNVPFNVSLFHPKLTRAQLEHAPYLEGVTLDISSSGLGLVVPAIRIGERYLTDAPLRILIDHPSGALQLVAQAVRYEQLPPDAGERGYLLGLHITAMTDDDRARFEEHLRQLG